MQNGQPDTSNYFNPLPDENISVARALLRAEHGALIGDFRHNTHTIQSSPLELQEIEAIALENSLSRLEHHLIELQTSQTFDEIIETAFGTEFGVSQAANIIQDWVDGHNRPDIAVVEDNQLSGVAAFGNDTVFLSRQLLEEDIAIS